MRYNAILIEELRSEFKFVIEHVTGVEERLTRRMDEKFEDVRKILTHHSDLLNENGESWKKNEERWQKNEEHWQKNDVRLERIEQKLDTVIEKVAEHDITLKKLTA